MTHRLIPTLIVTALLAAACASGGQPVSESASAPILWAPNPASPDSVPAGQTPVPRERAGRVTTTSPSPSALADRITPLPPAAGIPEPRTVQKPVSLQFEAIGVVDAPIDSVGVLDNGEMEIPGARNVGWYRYGPSPGDEGSAVLAAHIAYDGERGVFRFLGDAAPGDRFTVGYDDGSTRRFEVVEIAQYAKDELPFSEVFARSGSPVVTLISCGGEFQRSLNSYRDNIVVYAVPTG